MVERLERFVNLAELRLYVHQTLCQHERLEPGAFPVSERILVRRKAPCGLMFCLHGPRSVRFTAIWETDSNSIHFYSSTGERFQKTRVEDGLSWEQAVGQDPRLAAGRAA